MLNLEVNKVMADKETELPNSTSAQRIKEVRAICEGMIEDKDYMNSVFIGGSVARGDADSTSDTDIVVMPANSLRQNADAYFELTERLFCTSGSQYEVRTGAFVGEILIPLSELFHSEVPTRFIQSHNALVKI